MEPRRIAHDAQLKNASEGIHKIIDRFEQEMTRETPVEEGEGDIKLAKLLLNPAVETTYRARKEQESELQRWLDSVKAREDEFTAFIDEDMTKLQIEEELGNQAFSSGMGGRSAMPSTDVVYQVLDQVRTAVRHLQTFGRRLMLHSRAVSQKELSLDDFQSRLQQEMHQLGRVLHEGSPVEVQRRLKKTASFASSRVDGSGETGLASSGVDPAGGVGVGETASALMFSTQKRLVQELQSTVDSQHAMIEALQEQMRLREVDMEELQEELTKKEDEVEKLLRTGGRAFVMKLAKGTTVQGLHDTVSIGIMTDVTGQIRRADSMSSSINSVLAQSRIGGADAQRAVLDDIHSVTDQNWRKKLFRFYREAMEAHAVASKQFGLWRSKPQAPLAWNQPAILSAIQSSARQLRVAQRKANFSHFSFTALRTAMENQKARLIAKYDTEILDRQRAHASELSKRDLVLARTVEENKALSNTVHYLATKLKKAESEVERLVDEAYAKAALLQTQTLDQSNPLSEKSNAILSATLTQGKGTLRPQKAGTPGLGMTVKTMTGTAKGGGTLGGDGGLEPFSEGSFSATASAGGFGGGMDLPSNYIEAISALSKCIKRTHVSLHQRVMKSAQAAQRATDLAVPGVDVPTKWRVYDAERFSLSDLDEELEKALTTLSRLNHPAAVAVTEDLEAELARSEETSRTLDSTLRRPPVSVASPKVDKEKARSPRLSPTRLEPETSSNGSGGAEPLQQLTSPLALTAKSAAHLDSFSQAIRSTSAQSVEAAFLQGKISPLSLTPPAASLEAAPDDRSTAKKTPRATPLTPSALEQVQRQVGSALDQHAFLEQTTNNLLETFGGLPGFDDIAELIQIAVFEANEGLPIGTDVEKIARDVSGDFRTQQPIHGTPTGFQAQPTEAMEEASAPDQGVEVQPTEMGGSLKRVDSKRSQHQHSLNASPSYSKQTPTLSPRDTATLPRKRIRVKDQAVQCSLPISVGLTTSKPSAQVREGKPDSPKRKENSAAAPAPVKARSPPTFIIPHDLFENQAKQDAHLQRLRELILENRMKEADVELDRLRRIGHDAVPKQFPEYPEIPSAIATIQERLHPASAGDLSPRNRPQKDSVTSHAMPPRDVQAYLEALSAETRARAQQRNPHPPKNQRPTSAAVDGQRKGSKPPDGNAAAQRWFPFQPASASRPDARPKSARISSRPEPFEVPLPPPLPDP
jgi:hypothetical protein